MTLAMSSQLAGLRFLICRTGLERPSFSSWLEDQRMRPLGHEFPARGSSLHVSRRKESEKKRVWQKSRKGGLCVTSGPAPRLETWITCPWHRATFPYHLSTAGLGPQEQPCRSANIQTAEPERMTIRPSTEHSGHRLPRLVKPSAPGRREQRHLSQNPWRGFSQFEWVLLT